MQLDPKGLEAARRSNDWGHTLEDAIAAYLEATGEAPPPGWPDPLESPQAEAIRNGKIDMTEIVSLFDKMERELEQLRLVAADNAQMKRAMEFVARWAWRTDPPNANNKLTDGERLSAIKYYPIIKKYGDPHRELAEREVALAGKE